MAQNFDLNALSFEDTEAPKVQREGSLADNPITPLLAQTFENRQSGNGPTGKSVVVPNDQVGKIKYLVRCASDDLGIGSAVRVEPVGKTQSKVTFAGKPRKARKDDTAETPAESAAE